MQIQATDVEHYLEQLPAERRAVVERLRSVFLENLPDGFAETINYGMIGYVVPHSIYPAGYHCDPKQPLPFIGLAAQKSAYSVYHMGLYADAALLQWFQAEYPKHASRKLDMGKSCIRFKKPEDIPHALLAELAAKMRVQDWIACYESTIKK
jgi:hypothetical protein